MDSSRILKNLDGVLSTSKEHSTNMQPPNKKPRTAENLGKGSNITKDIDSTPVTRTEEARKYECNICGNKMSTKYTLSRHMKLTHDVFQETSDSTDEARKYECNICGNKMSTKSILIRHMKRTHDVFQGHISCVLCSDYRCRYRLQLIGHLNEKHGKELEVIHHTFESLQEFSTWKAKVEKETSSWFVSRKSDSTTTHYDCNRTGTYKPSGSGKRALKQQGTSKIGGHCTAYMTMKMESNGRVLVDACLEHVGHDAELHHLRIPKQTHNNIAGDLARGVSINSILDRVRENGDGISRENLIDRKDILNIKSKLNLHQTTTNKEKKAENNKSYEELLVSSSKSTVGADSPQKIISSMVEILTSLTQSLQHFASENPSQISSHTSNLKTLHSHMISFQKIAKGLLQTHHTPITEFPNKHFDPQPSFIKTRKPHNEPKHPFKNPTLRDTQEIEARLGSEHLLLCGICYKEDDGDDTDNVLWLECPSCKLLSHSKCHGGSETDCICSRGDHNNRRTEMNNNDNKGILTHTDPQEITPATSAVRVGEETAPGGQR